MFRHRVFSQEYWQKNKDSIQKFANKYEKYETIADEKMLIDEEPSSEVSAVVEPKVKTPRKMPEDFLENEVASSKKPKR